MLSIALALVDLSSSFRNDYILLLLAELYLHIAKPLMESVQHVRHLHMHSSDGGMALTVDSSACHTPVLFCYVPVFSHHT